jgi:hypothetical protein
MVKGRWAPAVSAHPADLLWEEDSARPRAARQASEAVLLGLGRTQTAGPPAVRMTLRHAAAMWLVQRRATGHEQPELAAIPKPGLIDWIATKTVS